MLLHIGKTLDGLCEIPDLLLVALRDRVADAVVDVPFQNDLPDFVERRFDGIDLRKDILAGDVLVDHPVDRLDLSADFCEPPMEVFRVHALFHVLSSVPLGVCAFYRALNGLSTLAGGHLFSLVLLYVRMVAAPHAGSRSIRIREVQVKRVGHRLQDAVGGEGRAADCADVDALRLQNVGDHAALGAGEILPVVGIGQHSDVRDRTVFDSHLYLRGAAQARSAAGIDTVGIGAGGRRGKRLVRDSSIARKLCRRLHFAVGPEAISFGGAHPALCPGRK